MSVDRDLLFGLLALQNGIINQGQLVASFQAWTLDKSKCLADHLEERGDLAIAKRVLLEALAEIHLDVHGGDVEKSLAAVAAGKSIREDLERIGDPDLEATLGQAGSSSTDGDPDRTATYSFGSATSDGQRFRVLRPHAKGGLGAVFVAFDGELNREVALKQILDHHADDPNSRQRFLVEAEITGGLEHPGIVPVYGLGTYDGGRPYYAMRFIRGDSLKEAIEQFHAGPRAAGAVAAKHQSSERGLELRRLLRRFLDVCNAIEYAHSRGVLHRDIKPGNVIVGKHGETLVVDWGLAKATGKREPDALERTLLPSSASGSAQTLPGSALGTPAYMSPEQAAGDLDRLGPRSDVYSLGATLYSLLTGKAPFVGDVGKVLHKVQQGDFKPPRQLDPSLDPALEAVCLKAMALKPEDRYASCKALADDVERWTADEPVTAWREPFARRVRRWANQNRTAVAAAAVALVAGVVGLSAVLAVQSRAKADIDVSLANETRANIALEAANAELTSSRAAVQARYDVAVDAIRTFHTGVSQDFLLKEPQFKNLRDRLLQSASDFYVKLGAVLGKESDLASRRALTQTQFDLAYLTDNVGRKEASLAAFQQVLAAREAMASESGADLETKADVGRSLQAIGGWLASVSKTDEAVTTLRKAEGLLAGLAESAPASAPVRTALAACRTKLGWQLYLMGQYADALSVFRLAQTEQESPVGGIGSTTKDPFGLAETIGGIGKVLEVTGKSTEALVEYRKAVAIYQKLADENPALIVTRNNLAVSHAQLGWLLSETGKPSEGEAEFRKALATWQKLADDEVAVTMYAYNLAQCHITLSKLLYTMGKSSEPELSKALAIAQKLTDDHPAVLEYGQLLALGRRGLGNALSVTGKPMEAEAEFRKALAIWQKLGDENPGSTNFRGDAAICLDYIGGLLERHGKPDEAIDAYAREEAIFKSLADAHPTVPIYRNNLANCQTNTAEVMIKCGRTAEARTLCERGVALREALVRDVPDYPRYRKDLAVSLLRFGQVHRAEGDFPGASSVWRRAIALIVSVPKVSGSDAFYEACCHASLSDLAGKAGARVSAFESSAEAALALDLLRQAVAMGFRDPDTYRAEKGLDPLHNRADFQALILDLEMPADPFAPVR